jgi:hypothetical protein
MPYDLEDLLEHLHPGLYDFERGEGVAGDPPA